MTSAHETRQLWLFRTQQPLATATALPTATGITVWHALARPQRRILAEVALAIVARGMLRYEPCALRPASSLLRSPPTPSCTRPARVQSGSLPAPSLAPTTAVAHLRVEPAVETVRAEWGTVEPRVEVYGAA